MGVLRVFGAALGWALVAALIHVVVVLIRVELVGAFTFATDLFALTVPVGYAVIFLVLAVPVAVPVAVGARFAPRLLTPGRVDGAFGALAFFSVLLMYRQVHPWSWLILAVAFGWQWAQWVDRRRRRPTFPHGPAMTGIATVLIAVLAVTRGVPVWREARAIGSVRTAPAGAPNVLLLILDTVRAANLGMYGYPRPTSPNIDSLAAASVVFDHAFSTSSWSLPSHASLLTGVWAHETGGSHLRRASRSLRYLAEVLRERGYLTAAFMANAGWAGHEAGLTRGYLRYVTHRDDVSRWLWATSLSRTEMAQELVRGLARAEPARMARALIRFNLRSDADVTATLRTAPEIVDAFTTWQRTVGAKHPWFATLNFFDAHGPYRTPFEERFNGGSTDLDKYDGAIAYVDDAIGRILSDLRRDNALDNTLVILTSDHGELFGEHGLTQHSGPTYLPVVQVPLLLRLPGRLPAGTRHDAPVTNADIPATVLDIVGAPAGLLPGRSLASAAADDTTNLVLFMANRMINAEPDHRAANGDIFGALTNEWHLIVDPDGREELYRWRDDPAEQNNLVADRAASGVLANLRSRLRAPSARRTTR